jgi:Lon protease-like protein
MVDLPLFPLQVVLFPGMVLPLRIFEERYKQMIGRCLETNEGFGVVLIREGQEVGEPAMPFEVGTLAQIASVERLPGGMMNLVTVGTRRFRCVEHTQVRPYRMARVEWLEDATPASAECDQLAGEVRSAVDEYVQLAYTLADQPRRAIEFPEDAAGLSFLAGSLLQQIGEVLNIGARERQQLLELTETAVRLRQELVYLRRGTRMLQLLLSRRDSGNAGSFSRN